MPSLLKSKNKSAVSKSTLTGGLVTGAAVLSFFLLPELISFFNEPSRPSSSAPAEKPLVVAKASPTPQVEELLATPTPEQIIVEEAQTQEPVTQERGEIKTVADVDRELERVRNDIAIEESEQQQRVSNGQALPVCLPPEQAELEADSQSLVPAKGEITWEYLRQEPVIKLLHDTRVSSNEILTALPETKKQSRFELTSFIDSINVLTGELTADAPSSNFSPEDALRFLDHRDVAVSRAFFQESVPRILIKKWQEISLAELIRDSMAKRVKSKILKPFRPKLVITDLTLRYDWVTRIREYPRQPLRVQLKGYVIDGETESVEWYFRNRPRERFKAHLEKPDRFGRRFFELPYRYDIKRDRINVVAVASDNARFLKQYNFYPRARQLAPRIVSGEAFLRLPYRPFDPRVDKAFLVKQANVREDGSLLQGSFGSSPIVAF